MDPASLLRSILASLVDHPDAISVVPVETERVLTLDVRVHPSDVGKVLGVDGQTVEALRDLYRAVGGTVKKRIDIHVTTDTPS